MNCELYECKTIKTKKTVRVPQNDQIATSPLWKKRLKKNSESASIKNLLSEKLFNINFLKEFVNKYEKFDLNENAIYIGNEKLEDNIK